MTAIFCVVCDGPANFERWKLQAWGLICLAWDIDELFYVDKCKGEESLGTVQFHETRMKAREVESIQAALDEAKHLRAVCVEGPLQVGSEAKEIRHYVHRDDAIYLFGGDRSSGLWPSMSKLEADWVSVPAKRGVYGYLIGGIVAQHRAQTLRR